jgi:hypothetical protein
MSYILDALKRAERDRHLRYVPTLVTIHATAHPTRSRWLWVGVGVLLVNAIVVTWVLYAGRDAGPASTTSAAVTPTGAIQKSAQSTATESEGRASRSAMGGPVPPGGESSATARSTRERSSAPPPTPVSSEAAAPGSAPAGPQSTFATLKLEMVVNADDPAERAAYISGRRYVTGQSLERGAIIESIGPNAVVLRWAGQRYLLSWEHPPTLLGR